MLLVPALLLALTLTTDDGPEWGGFLGTKGTGLGAPGAYPDTLDPAQNLLWKQEVPPGYSSPTVCGDRIFLTAVEEESLLTLCLDRATGQEQWRKEIPYDGRRPGANSPAAPTPVTDGESVFSLFHNFGLVAYDLEGEELWSQEMGPWSIPHGLSTSPLIVGDLLILQLDHDAESLLVGVNKYDGELLWSSERPGANHSYATPALWQPAQGPAEVVVAGSHRICGYSVEDGSLLWFVEGAAFMTKSSPVILGDRCYVTAYTMSYTEAGMPRITQTFEEALAEKDADGDSLISPEEMDVPALAQAWFVFDLDDDGFFDQSDWNYIKSSMRPTGGLFAIQLGGRGDVTESHVIWKYDGRRGLPDATSTLVVDGTVYVIKSGSLLSAFDADTGDLAKQDRVGSPDQYFATPVAADGKIYVAGVGGQLAVLKAGKEWEVLSVTNLDEATWSTPALVDGQVLVRSQKALYCFGAVDA